MAALPKILHPAIVNERVSRLRVVNNTLQKKFKMTAGGAASQTVPSRRGSYDVFNETREVATATVPGTHAAVIARQPVGNVPFTIPRTAEKLPILMEEVNQLRAIGGPTNTVDSLGEVYIAEQEKEVKRRFTNLREFQVAALLRGSYTYTQSSADQMVHGFSGGSITINYQMPSGNKSQLDMLGGGDIIGVAWDNNAAPIVRDLFAVNSAFEELVGRGLKEIICTSVVWGFVITNAEVQNLAGSVNNPVREISKDDDNEQFTAVLNGAGWVDWTITDNGLNLNGTFTKLIGDTDASFLTRIDTTVVKYYECPEPVVDPVTNQHRNEVGEYYYHKLIDDPVSYEFHGRHNGLPVLFVPAALAYGTVDF